MWILAYWILAVLCYHGCSAQTNLYETIRNNVNTSKFADLLDNAGLRTLLEQSTCTGGSQCLTVFAPMNSAVDKLMQMSEWNALSPVRKSIIVSGHIIRANRPLSAADLMQQGMTMNLMDIGFGQGRTINFLLTQNRYAFQRQNQREMIYLINSARVTQPNVAATNGMIHVIDEPLYTPSCYLPIIDYLLGETDLKKSAELWITLALDAGYTWMFDMQKHSEFYGTYFFVTDQGWAQVPQEQMNRLQENITLLAEVLSYQVFSKQLVYSQWANILPQIKLQNGFRQGTAPSMGTNMRSSMLTRSASGKVSLMSGLSMVPITSPGKEIRQAIVHKVSAPLGFIYETREDVVKRLNPNLLLACQADAFCSNKLTGSKLLTFFVPTQASWLRFTSLNATQKELILKYLVIEGIIAREQMTSSYGITIDTLPYAIRFRTDATDTFVDGRLQNQGYVGARLVLANQVATDGIAHSIDGIPGLVFQTVAEYLAQTPSYSKFNSYGFVQTQKMGGPYIYLAPTDAALTTMANDAAVGAKLLGDERRRNYVFRRLSFPLLMPFEYLSPGQYFVPTANLAFTNETLMMYITIQGNERVMSFSYAGITSEVWSRNGGFQFKDGVVYQSDKLLYGQSDLTRNLCTNPGCP